MPQTLCEQAREKFRLRVNYDFRNSASDTSQCMLNALCSGTIVPIHRHPDTTEVMMVVQGSV
ncbi:MAG: WbuC family cupin fold metalloprotein [Bacteroidaceae bacterium]|nr:WbuC family cupin fold metalloprotein [Bacteroidaceae bacterium]